MSLSPNAYADWSCRPYFDERKGAWRDHIHLVPAIEESGFVMGIEDVAQLLSESIAVCNEDRHLGHGYQHGADEPELAYKKAIYDLFIKDFDKEKAESDHRLHTFRKWGSHMPAAVLMHDQDKKLQIIIPDHEGNPTMREVPKRHQDLLPTPTSDVARRDKLGIGWRIKKGKNRRK
jgi:hypothetical protein